MEHRIKLDHFDLYQIVTSLKFYRAHLASQDYVSPNLSRLKDLIEEFESRIDPDDVEDDE